MVMACPKCGKSATLLCFDGREPNRILVWICGGCAKAFRSLERDGTVLT